MAAHLARGERLFICDAFEAPTDDQYATRATIANVLASIARTNPDLDQARIVIHACLSTELALSPKDRFRFIHVDGGHSSEVAYSDLKLATRHAASKGVIVVDDYHNPAWPDVTVGVDRFLSENHELEVLGDMNRHGSLGRKLYLIKRDG
jgi:hypothetical protein